MSTSLEVPALGESITEAIVAKWLKQVGEAVAVDEPVVELETDKITVEVPAPAAGVLTKQLAEEGATVNVGDLIAELDANATASAAPAAAPAATPEPAPAPAAAAEKPAAMPAAQHEAGRSGVDLDKVEGTGRGGRILKEDVQRAAAQKPAPAAKPAPAKPLPAKAVPAAPAAAGERETRVPMTRLRKRIAENLVQAQTNAAILTTFNEVDMTNVMALRKRYKDAFIKKHDVKLGFMSFFVKAAVHALQEVKGVNARIEGDEIVYNNFYDIGVAVGGGKGLVVPVIRDADRLSFAQIESEIIRLATLAKTNKLQISDLTGGTFTISNGGIYGSMLSTPILNPPQSGILGLHNIVERPMAVNGQVEIRPVMYLALSYDHRLVDGREAVTFLIRIKDAIENPERLLLDV
jgi:2-oxoglutarate dehydrogenase E2 component (dihydrolipoamide succinyltransferase)